MDGSIKSDSRLEVSVSFGRFENDALSWEKWSSFSPNKYLEEVGTLSTPGSVAQKKAYFEAHYKKIAAKKAEESDHDRRFMYPIIPISNVLPDEPSDRNPPETDSDPRELGPLNGQKPADEVSLQSPNMHVAEEVTPGSCVTSLSTVTNCDDDAEVDTGASFSRVENIASANASTDEIASDKQRETDVTVTESRIEEAKDGLMRSVADPKSGKGKKLVFDTMENRQKASTKMMVKSSTPERKKMGVERGSSLLNKERTQANSRSIAQKVTPIKNERDSAAAKRKVITPSSAKSLPAVTPRQPKSAPSISITPLSSASNRPLKKVNSSSLPTSKKPVEEESKKKIAPTSLHMSISLGSPNSSSGTSTMTRKSLIMEKMGDKDIVKRAFKAFQNHRIMDEKPVRVLPPASQPKLAAYTPPWKVNNKGPRKDAQKLATPKSQQVIRSSLYPSSSRNWKDLTAISPAAPVGLKSDDKPERRKEFMKKLEARSKARVAENARTHAKSKEGKDSGLFSEDEPQLQAK